MQRNSELLSDALANLSRQYDFYQTNIEDLTNSVLELTLPFMSSSIKLAELMQLILSEGNEIITQENLEELSKSASDFNKICEPYREEFQTQKMLSPKDIEALSKAASDFNKICEPYRIKFEHQKIQDLINNEATRYMSTEDLEALRKATSNFCQEASKSNQTTHHTTPNKPSNRSLEL